MSRGDNPWGEDPEGKASAERPEVEPAAAEAGTPHNPWLIPNEEPRPRRSASIEDIFKPGKGSLRNPIGNGWIRAAFGAVIAAWLAGTSFHVLDRDERALVMTMGRYSETIGPGVHLTMPWPFQTLLRRDVGADVTTAVPETPGETLMPTRDGELVDVSFNLRWRVGDLKAFAFNLPEGEAAVRRLAEAQVRATIAELPFEAVWNGSRRNEIAQRALQRTQRVLDAWHAGVTVVALDLVAANPPGQLAAVFEKIAEAQDLARRQRDNDLAWRTQQIDSAKKEVADYQLIYARYKIAPEITRINMYYEAMERILKVNRVIFGGSGVPAVPPPPGPLPTGGAGQ